MKKQIFISCICLLLPLAYLLTMNSCVDSEKGKENEFSFVFMTDIHLQPERKAPEGFKMAIDKVNELNPDFVITGGDLIMDALGQSWGRSDSLYKLYQEYTGFFKMPVNNTIGNHEIYGIYRESKADPSHPEYGEKMFEQRLGPSWYAFSHKGWKFFILNSIEDTKRSSYIGWVDSLQMAWLNKELSQTDKQVPLVISTHIPFLTIYAQKYDGSTLANDSSLVVANSKQVLDLFKEHNLRLVLQGHLHTVEEIKVDNVSFITAGAVSGKWWSGANRGFEEGFVKIDVNGQNFKWKYIDYGWTVN